MEREKKNWMPGNCLHWNKETGCRVKSKNLRCPFIKKQSNGIGLEKEAVKEYLNKHIEYWKAIQNASESGPYCAVFYVDAYKKIRSALLGEEI